MSADDLKKVFESFEENLGFLEDLRVYILTYLDEHREMTLLQCLVSLIAVVTTIVESTATCKKQKLEFISFLHELMVWIIEDDKLVQMH